MISAQNKMLKLAITAILTFSLFNCSTDEVSTEVKHGTTDSQGKVEFTDSQTEEKVTVTIKEKSTGKVLPGTKVAFIDGVGFETFIMNKSSYMPLMKILSHNSSHQFDLTPASVSPSLNVYKYQGADQAAVEKLVDWADDIERYDGCYSYDQLKTKDKIYNYIFGKLGINVSFVVNSLKYGLDIYSKLTGIPSPEKHVYHRFFFKPTSNDNMYAAFFTYIAREKVNEIQGNGLDDNCNGVVDEKGGNGKTNMIVHWKFDEGSGTTTKDSSGNSNNGKTNSTQWTSGVVGIGALSFDGKSSYVEMSDSGKLSGFSKMTAACWFKAKAFDTNETGYLISKDKQGDGIDSNDSYALSLSATKSSKVQVYASVWSSSGSKNVGVPKEMELKTGQWYHAAFTYDGSTIKLYLDGTEIGSKQMSNSVNSNTSVPLRVGQCSGSRTRYFDGAIDDVRIYNGALSSNEIGSLFQMGSK